MMRLRWRPRLAVLVLMVMMVGAGVAAQERDAAPVTDAMLQNPDPADWLNWRRTLDGWGYSPLAQIDRNNVHRLQLVWGWQMNTGTNQPHSARARRRDVSRQPGQRRAGARRGDRGSAVGVPARSRRRGRVGARPAQPLDRRLRRQGVPEHGGRAHRRARPGHRRGGVGPRGRRQRARLPLHERADRRQRQRRGRHDRLRALQGGRLLHLRPRRGDRRGTVAHLDHRPSRRPGRRFVGRFAAAVPRRGRLLDPGQLRSRDEPDLLVDLAGQAVGQRDPRDRRGRAVQQQRAGPRRRHRRAVLVLPVHPR